MAMFDRRRENKQTFDESRNLNAVIRDCNNVDGHIEYKVEVWKSPEPEVRYSLTYRYSQFAQLNAALRAPNVTLPVLPPKKFFGNTDKSFVNDRKVALQNYMDELTKHPILRHHQALKNFLDPTNHSSAHHENGTMSVAAVLRSGGRLELGNPLTAIGWRYHKQYFHVSQVRGSSGASASSGSSANTDALQAAASVTSSSSSPELTSAALAHTLHVAPPKASLMLWWCPYAIDSTMHLRDVHGTLTTLVQCQHPYLATTLSSVATETGVCVTMPYYPQGSLRDLLYGARPDQTYVVKYASNRSTSAAVAGVSVRSTAVYGRQILTALNFLHYKGVGHEGSNFRQNIRNYNPAFAFASFGAIIRPPPGREPYCFRLQGQTCHYASNLHGDDPEERRYGQLYILETNEAIQTRANAHENANCLVSVFQKINEAMNNNPYAAAYYNMWAIEQQEQERTVIENMPPRQVTMQFIPGSDRRRYNNPTGNEIAAIFVGDDGAPPMYRDIVLYPIGLQRHRIAYISCHLDPMVYSLLFANGEPGWHINMPHVEQRQTCVRNKVTMQEFYSYRLVIRDDFSALHRAGKLLQQYIVDAYVKVEGCLLNFIKNNQAQLRVALYLGLMDHLDRQNDNQQPDVPVIFSSIFTGSPRNMQQAYQDAMAVLCKFGKPDIFLTYTCNQKCQEITENLGLHETAQHRPDLVSRVYKRHLKELLIDIKNRHIFGVPVAHIHVIEFQKRGLPHNHLLIILREEDKLRTREQIDDIVCAEIPSSDHPELRECVRTLMIHGP
ncbi:Phoxous domain [Trinorchestia longiramus]|nr:Phoxous domain [Trinorchestia longiramus]